MGIFGNVKDVIAQFSRGVTTSNDKDSKKSPNNQNVKKDILADKDTTVTQKGSSTIDKNLSPVKQQESAISSLKPSVPVIKPHFEAAPPNLTSGTISFIPSKLPVNEKPVAPKQVVVSLLYH